LDHLLDTVMSASEQVKEVVGLLCAEQTLFDFGEVAALAIQLQKKLSDA
jgi:hypothetical protein